MSTCTHFNWFRVWSVAQYYAFKRIYALQILTKIKIDGVLLPP